MCNCLWSYSPFIALAKENNIRIALPHFYIYNSLFPNLNSDDNVITKAPIKALGSAKVLYFFYKIVVKLLKLFNRFFNLKAINIYINFRQWEKESWTNEVLLKKNALVFTGSWNCEKDNDSFLRNKKYILSLFQPDKECIQAVDRVFYKLRQNFDLIIGLHVRRGDYKTFIDGRYYFDDPAYANFVRQLVGQMPGRRVVTYIASNENIELSYFEGLAVHHVPNSLPLIDLESLGRCDYILGPPSTFSMWASFANDKPLLFLKKTSAVICLNEFSPIINQNEFKNGKIFTH